MGFVKSGATGTDDGSIASGGSGSRRGADGIGSENEGVEGATKTGADALGVFGLHPPYPAMQHSAMITAQNFIIFHP